MRDHSIQRCYQLTKPVPPPGSFSRVNLSSVNSNTNHRALLSGTSARVEHRRPLPAISNLPALPDTGTSYRRAAATPEVGVRLQPSGMFGDSLRGLLDPRLRGGDGGLGSHGAGSVTRAIKTEGQRDTP